MGFREERGIAYCGLACVLCSVEDCPGCKAGIAYYTPDGWSGDYDKPETEEEIYRLLRYGRD